MKNKKYANRGMQLEKKIDKANKEYLKGEGIQRTYVASIHKIPTPVQITKDNGKSITGFKKRGELVDYIGTLLGGHAIAFDAKETKGKSLPLANIHESQFKFLETWFNYGATTFLIVHFSGEDKYYRLDFKTLSAYWKGALNGSRKSIPISAFENELIYQNGILYYLEGL